MELFALEKAGWNVQNQVFVQVDLPSTVGRFTFAALLYCNSIAIAAVIDESTSEDNLLLVCSNLKENGFYFLILKQKDEWKITSLFSGVSKVNKDFPSLSLLKGELSGIDGVDDSLIRILDNQIHEALTNRYHQKQALTTCIRSYLSLKKFISIVLAPGAGLIATVYEVIALMRIYDPELRIALIVGTLFIHPRLKDAVNNVYSANEVIIDNNVLYICFELDELAESDVKQKLQSQVVFSFKSKEDRFSKSDYSYTYEEIFFDSEKPPKGFKQVHLKEIATVKLGISVTHSLRNATYRGAPVTGFCIRPVDVRKKHILTKKFLSEVEDKKFHSARESERLVLYDILISRIYSSGGPVIVFIESLPDEPVFATDAFFLIRITDESVNAKTAFEYLTSVQGRKVFERMSKGIVHRMLNFSLLKELRITIPEIQTSGDDLKQFSQLDLILKSLNQKIEEYLVPGAGDSELVEGRIAVDARTLFQILNPISIEDRVKTEFPTCIALPFAKFISSRFNPYESLQRLKDVFEAITYFFYYVCLSDSIINFNSNNINHRSSCFKNSVGNKIFSFKTLLEHAKNNKCELFVQELFDTDIVEFCDDMQREFRNKMSHSGTWDDSKVEKVLGKYGPRVLDICQKIDFLSQYKLIQVQQFHVVRGKMQGRFRLYKGVLSTNHEDTFDLKSIEAMNHKTVGVLNERNCFLSMDPFFQVMGSRHEGGQSNLVFFKYRDTRTGCSIGESVETAEEVEMPGFDLGSEIFSVKK